MINDVPTVFEVVTGTVKQVKDQPTAPNNNRKNKSSGRMVSAVLYNLVFKILFTWFAYAWSAFASFSNLGNLNPSTRQ